MCNIAEIIYKRSKTIIGRVYHIINNMYHRREILQKLYTKGLKTTPPVMQKS